MEVESPNLIPDALAEALDLSPADLDNLRINEDCLIILGRFAKVWGDQQLVRASWKEELSELKAEQARQQADADQKLHDLEHQLAIHTQHIREETAAKERLSGQLSLAVGEAEQYKYELFSAKEDLQRTTEQVASLQHDHQQAELDKRQLTQIAERRSGEIERVNAEWKEMSEKLTAAVSAKVEAETKLDDVTGVGMSGQLREKRLEQEKDMLASQVAWLNQELKSKSDELLATRKEKSSLALDSQTSLNKTNDDLAAAQTTCDNLREMLQERENKIESSIKQVKELRDEKLDLENQFKNEIACQTKLAALHQETATDAKQKLDSLVDGARNLQELLTEASQGREEAEEQLKAREEIAHEKIEQLENAVGTLERELENANDLLNVARQRGQAPMTDQQVTNMSPYAASTSSRLQSGMTLTQIYSLYVEATDELRLQRDENQQLVAQLNQIAAELREKAPLMEQMHREYEDAIHMNQQLSGKVEAGLLECERLRLEADDSVRIASQLKRENVRLEVRCKDTTQQVRVLLREVEEARGGLGTTSVFDASLPHVDNDVTSSDEVISAQLVSFKSIEELQAQNEKLLTVVRELSNEQEQNERKQRDAELEELRDSHAEALQQLEDLRQQRSRTKTVMDALAKQRDLYRVLAQSSSPDAAAIATQLQASKVLASIQSPGSLSSADVSIDDSFQSALSDATAPAAGGGDREQAEDARALRGAMEELTKEFREYREQTSQNTDVLTSQLDQYREDASQAKMDNAKLVSKLEYGVERQELLTSNAEGYRTELEATRQKNNQMNVATAKLQMSLDTTSQDLVDARDRLRRAERRSEDLTQENRLSKASNEQMQREIDSLRREQSNQRTLLASLQTIQNNVERNDFEMRTRLSGQLETAQEELTAVRRRLDADTEYHRSVVSAYEVQLKELRDELTTERKQANTYREQLSAAKASATAATQKSEELEAQLKSLQHELDAIKERTERATAGGEGSEIARLTLQLTQAEARCTGLEEQLTLAQQHVDQYKAISEASEAALTELNQANDDFRKRYEDQIAAAGVQREEVDQRLAALQQDHEKLLSDNMEAERNFQQEIAQLHEKVKKTSAELSTALQAQTAAVRVAEQARDDLRLQQSRATEAQDRYEREMVLHSVSMKELTTVRDQLQKMSEELTTLNDRSERAEQALSSTVSKQSDKLAVKDESIERAEQKCKDWEQQSELLHQQLEKLSAQVITLQSQLTSSSSRTAGQLPDGSAPGDRSSSDRSENELREIIRFIRHEKEIAETKAELSQSESSRYSQRCEHLDRQMQSLRESLDEERRRAQLHAETAGHHAEIMEKVQTLNLLQDSNKLLREDRDRLQRRVVQLEAKSTQLESQIAPLKSSNHQLTAAREALVAERTALKTEVDRWSHRCNSLMEQCNKVDQEEYQQLKVLKENNEKEISTLNKTIADVKESLSDSDLATAALRDQCSVLDKKCTQAKAESSKELESKGKELEAKAKELVDSRKALLDSRRAGMRTNTRLTAMQTKITELEANLAAEKSKVESAASQDEVKELKEQVAKLTSDIEVVQRNEKEANLKATRQEEKAKNLNTMVGRLRTASQQQKDNKRMLEEEVMKVKTLAEETEGRWQEASKQRDTLLAKVNDLTAKCARMQKVIAAFKQKAQAQAAAQPAAAAAASSSSSSKATTTTTTAAAVAAAPPAASAPVPAASTATTAVVASPAPSAVIRTEERETSTLVAAPAAAAPAAAATTTPPVEDQALPTEPVKQEAVAAEEEMNMDSAAAAAAAAATASTTPSTTASPPVEVQTSVAGQSVDTGAGQVDSTPSVPTLTATTTTTTTAAAIADEDMAMHEESDTVAAVPALATVTLAPTTPTSTPTPAATAVPVTTGATSVQDLSAVASSTQTPTVVVRPAAVASGTGGNVPTSTAATAATAGPSGSAGVERTNTPTASIRPMPTPPVVLPPTAAVAPTPSVGQSSVFPAPTTTTTTSSTGVVVSPPAPASMHVAVPATGGLVQSSVVQQAESTTADGSHFSAAPASALRGAKRPRESEGQEATSSVESAPSTGSSTEGQASVAKRRFRASDDATSLGATSASAVSTSAVASSSTSSVSTFPSCASPPEIVDPAAAEAADLAEEEFQYVEDGAVEADDQDDIGVDDMAAGDGDMLMAEAGILASPDVITVESGSDTSIHRFDVDPVDEEDDIVVYEPIHELDDELQMSVPAPAIDEDDGVEMDDNDFLPSDAIDMDPIASVDAHQLGENSPASFTFGLDVEAEADAGLPGDEVTSSMATDSQQQFDPIAPQSVDDLISTASSSAAPSPVHVQQQQQQLQDSQLAAPSQQAAASSQASAAAGSEETRTQPVALKRGLRRLRRNLGPQQDDIS